jgi:hypothetical protein
MVNDSAFGGSIWGGAPKEVAIPALATNDTAGNFSNLVSSVNDSVPLASTAASILPGGTLKFNSVSSRSVSMSESFPRPVIIGYNGFSLAIARGNDIPGIINYTNKAGIASLQTNMQPTIFLGESIISNEKLLEIKGSNRRQYAPRMQSVNTNAPTGGSL